MNFERGALPAQVKGRIIDPPEAHKEAAMAESKRVVPLDETGKPSKEGKNWASPGRLDQAP